MFKDKNGYDLVFSNFKFYRVKKVIDTETLVLLNSLCEKYLIENNNIENIATFKTLFDMVIVNNCTNVKIQGINLETKENESTINVEINSEMIKDFEKLNLLPLITSKIINYNNAWENIKTYITNKLYLSVFFALENMIPKTEDFNETIESTKKALTELKTQYPEIIKDVALRETRTDIKREKSK